VLHEDVHFAVLAAVEHMRSLVWILRRPQQPSLSLATVTRGALEALSRAYWILDAPTPGEKFVRHSQLAYHDVVEAFSSGSKQVSYNAPRGDISGQQLRDDIRAYLRELSAGPGNKVGAHAILLNLLEAADGEKVTTDAQRREVYSTLSAVAHGQSFAIQSFVKLNVTEQGTADAVGLSISGEQVIEYSAYVHYCAVTMADRVIEYYQPAQHFVDRWRQISERALAVRQDAL
jgi:hypothetical protein